MPSGTLVTRPTPRPVLATVSVARGRAWKLAVTVLSLLRVTLHIAVSLQSPPLQPTNAEPVSATAVRATVVPPAKTAAHLDPQAIPAGLLLTLPVPVPPRVTVSVAACTLIRYGMKGDASGVRVMLPSASRASR